MMVWVPLRSRGNGRGLPWRIGPTRTEQHRQARRPPCWKIPGTGGDARKWRQELLKEELLRPTRVKHAKRTEHRIEVQLTLKDMAGLLESAYGHGPIEIDTYPAEDAMNLRWAMLDGILSIEWEEVEET